MLLTATMTEVKGGTSHNVTPKECETIFDIRIPVDMNCKTVEQKIANIVKDISKRREVEAFYSILMKQSHLRLHITPTVEHYLAIMDVEKTRPKLIRKTGTGDMNVLGTRWNIPVVTYGPGDPHEASHH